MKSLLPLNVVEKMLSKFEPVESLVVNAHTPSSIQLGDNWPHAGSELSTVPGAVFTRKADGETKDYTITKKGILRTATHFGISQKYAGKIPGSLLAYNLNWHLANMEALEYSALVVKGEIQATSSHSTKVYSNLQFLDSMIAGIKKKFGNVEALVDRRTFNTLGRTDIRLVVPSTSVVVHHSTMEDFEGVDSWRLGIHFTTSVSGEETTEIRPYLIRDNGENAVSIPGDWKWHRNRDNLVDVYQWLANSTVEALTAAESYQKVFQDMDAEVMQSGIGKAVAGHLKQFHVIHSLQAEVAEPLIKTPVVTNYTIMNAISAYADTPGLSAEYINRFTLAAGDYAKKIKEETP